MSSWIELGDRRFAAWIGDYAIPLESLAIYRVLYALVGLWLVIPRWAGVGDLPDQFFVPRLSIASFFRGFPPDAFFVGLNAVAVACLIGILLGAFTRVSSFGFAAVVLVGNSFGFATGKIDHEILLILVPVLLAVAGWGKIWSVDARATNAPAGGEDPGQRPVGWPLVMLALLIGFAMLTAAVQKIQGGWLSWDSQATYGNLLANHFIVERETVASAIAVTIDVPWLWELADWATVLLEAVVLLSVARLASFRLFVGVAVLFHVAVFVTMDILFMANLIAYGAFVDWSRLAAPVASRTFVRADRAIARAPTIAVVMSAVLVAVVYAVWGNPAQQLATLVFQDAARDVQEWAFMSLAMVATVAAAVSGIRDRGQPPLVRADGGNPPATVTRRPRGRSSGWPQAGLDVDV